MRFMKYYREFCIFCMLLLIQGIYCTAAVEKICEAKTSYGDLLGKHMTSRTGITFCAFLGIPYASPPSGNLRFLPPISTPKWEGIRNATKEKEQCLQLKYGGSEDCLYLNVFTHSTQNNTSLPVMVYIHGGGFYYGSSSMELTGPEYLMDRDIVLVTLQYRLGPFGFLSTEDEVVPGNMGLKDQVKALQWVQENIDEFNGDPEKVIIFGCSAGGASVHLHMQSPLSKDLFARGISQSGTALSRFAVAPAGVCKNITKNIALSLNCSINTSQEIFQCLQNKNFQEILEAYAEQLNMTYNINRILLRPVVEKSLHNAFLTKHPNKSFTTKPWLVGVNKNEGISLLTWKKYDRILNLIKNEFHDFGKHLLFFEDKKDSTNVLDQIYQFYFQNSSSFDEWFRSIEQLVTDSWFVWPTENAIKQHNGILYYYLYDHQGEHSFSDFYKCPKGYGVSHIDELLSLFTQKNIFPERNEQDTKISKVMVDFWVNFAREGNPTPQAISSNPQRNEYSDFIWQASKNTDPTFIHIQTNKLSLEKKLFAERMNFWNQLHLIHDF